jgi:hypothetical protein
MGNIADSNLIHYELYYAYIRSSGGVNTAQINTKHYIETAKRIAYVPETRVYRSCIGSLARMVRSYGPIWCGPVLLYRVVRTC